VSAPTRVDLSAKVEVRWEVEHEYRMTISLGDLLRDLDINEDECFNEDGTCRFTSVQEAIRWARDEGLRGSSGEDFLINHGTERNLHDVDVDPYGAMLREVKP
jgi:hypothetical protein